MAMNKVVHAAQRAAFSVAIDTTINAVRGKGPENMAEQAVKLVNLAQPLLAKRYPDANWDAVRAFVSDPNSKWMQYAYRAINEIDPHILKMNALNLVYEGMFAGYNYVMELREKYDCNMPWILLFDPTSACNLHCKGCWAAEYGNRLNLSFEDMDRIVTEGEELGIHWYMCTGGEPTCRKEDLFKLAEKHQSSVFHLFTNGTLIDQAFCDRVKQLGNMAFFISIEGIGDATDDRRGAGVYDRVMHAMDLMKENGLLFGTSICYTSANYKAVTSDEFMDMLISHGVRFNWYFHYMPIGDGANVNLMLNAEQREYMIHRVREIRGYTGGKPIFCIDFQNDGEYIDGCSSPCSRNITRASLSTTTICVPARCWKTPSCWARWSDAAAPIAPICSSRNPPAMSSAAASPTPTSGLRLLTASGLRNIPIVPAVHPAPPVLPSKTA